MAVKFQELTSQEGLKQLNDYLLTRSYITGYQASRDDLSVFAALRQPVPAEFVNLSRWHSHIAALVGPSFSGAAVGVHIESGATSAAATSQDLAPSPALESAAATPEAPAEEGDDDLDLFGDETEEEAAAAAEREAAKKAAGTKKKESGKSSVLLDVKPWDDETDMKKLEECVRSVSMPGLFWGASKFVQVVAGIKKLQIMMTIVDDEVSVDNLIEDHLTSEPNNEYIQSCDIVAFNKICKFQLPFLHPISNVTTLHFHLTSSNIALEKESSSQSSVAEFSGVQPVYIPHRMVFAVLVHARVTDILIKFNIGNSVLLQTSVQWGLERKRVCSYFLTQAIAISFGADNVLFFMSTEEQCVGGKVRCKTKHLSEVTIWMDFQFTQYSHRKLP